MSVDRFFQFAHDRHEIYLRRQAGLPREQWTTDPILQTYKFTNVYRELDRTTIAHRKLTNAVADHVGLLPFVVATRWFNRIETWDRMLAQAGSAMLLASALLQADRRALIERHIRGFAPPYVTGAYIIKTPDGMDKLDGVWWCIAQFITRSAKLRASPGSTTQLDCTWDEVTLRCREHASPPNLQMIHEWLLQFPYLGGFMAYEIVSDLRWTPLACNASDIMTWAHAGPGAMRGLNRIHGRDLNYSRASHPWVQEMQALLMRATVAEISAKWPRWEMREVEHTLCEFDKYERVRLGQGAPRSKFVPTP